MIRIPESGVKSMDLTALNEKQKNLVAAHTDIVKWAIFGHIRINENVYGLGYDDLFQEGCLCLCKAAVSYDGDRAKFVTYAQVVVRNGLLTYCKQLSKKSINIISISELPQDPGDSDESACGYTIEDQYELLISEAAVSGLLESVKPEYIGVARLGIEALELKVKGYTGAEIARMWGVEQNYLGACISRAKEKLIQNERFMAELKAV